MKNWTIARHLTLGFTCVILINLALSGFASWRFLGLQKNITNLAGDTLPSVLNLTEWISVVKDNLIITHEHLATESNEQMAAIEQQIAAGTTRRIELLKEYEKLLSDDEDLRLFNAAKVHADHYTEVRNKMLTMSRQGQKAEARKFLVSDVDPAFEAYAKAVQAAIDRTVAVGNADAAAGVSAAQSGIRLIVVALVVATVVGIALAWLIARVINRTLRTFVGALGDGSEQVAAAAGQVSASSQSLAEGASEQAASLEETSASLEEMLSMTKRSAENANQAKTIASAARASGEVGAQKIQMAHEALQAIKTASHDITKILKTIDEIAFQTNILALNAAVEAARAGEAGAGFAVVADEVRALAQRCAAAAHETAAKIEDSVTKSQHGVELGAEVSRSFADIKSKIQELDGLVAEIATAANEQSQGIGQVTTAVSQMDKVTQSNAANAEETASAAEELNSQSQMLKESVVSLQLLISRTENSGEPKNHDRGADPSAGKNYRRKNEPLVTPKRTEIAKLESPKRDRGEFTAVSANGNNGHDDFFRSS
jgi:methyl-accepting chemotaxis protein